jgi:hypothetical protein
VEGIIAYCFLVLDIEIMNQKTEESRLAADDHPVGSDVVAFGADDEIRKVAALPVAIWWSDTLITMDIGKGLTISWHQRKNQRACCHLEPCL